MNNPKFTLRGLLLLIALVALFFGAWLVTIRKRPVTIEETTQIKIGGPLTLEELSAPIR